MRLLLDTHILLWWLADDRKLAKNARATIANPDNEVFISSATLWEIAIKAALGRLEVELDDLEDAIARNGFRSLPIGFRHALTASRRRLDDLFQSLLHRAFAGELSTQNADEVSLAASLQPTEQLRHAPTVKHSKGIMYRRAALDCYLITALKGDKNLGRTKIEKISHLMEYHCGVGLERVPLRDAAGPNDYQSRMKVESLARKQNVYSTRTAADKLKVDYLPGPEISKSRRTAENFLGERKSAVDALISLMRPLDTKASEIVATLYAAWNDFLLAGKTPTDDELISEVRHNWHPEKLSIPPDQWIKGLAWMRKYQLIPRGIGKPTIRNKAI